ncbi:polyprenyl synthetase family protein [Pseudalkalibacillus salsuginis]|uniref:polyprenyl synthetase family protein n=1 Tax=Pseudalkalibacillus salsuginis TaxID=2910972 RepID=UPI001F404C84|nr:farnesyl diphosphate synthase [Pseudalkalibacillus salsuginis]MCF6408393.1 polyprenyl synthetase family protein [Pseudalkalibacillus salsuginis]
MDKNTFLQLLQQKKNLIDETLPGKVDRLQGHTSLKEAMLYSILAGGKRLRPTLLLMTIEAFEKDSKFGLDAACAVEMIHTYSLIHDDLPAMDDDDFRRGNLTNHKIYGEAMAILAGDALLTYAFEVISGCKLLNDELKVDLIMNLSKAAGPEGMVDGQAADLEGEGKSLSLGDLEQIHRKKTGALLGYAIYAGARIAGGERRQLDHLIQFAHHLGLAFQIQDDILDVEGDEAKIGKPIGSDVQNNKSTYPNLLTITGAKDQLFREVDYAKKHLYKAGIKHEWLEHFTDFMISRDH